MIDGVLRSLNLEKDESYAKFQAKLIKTNLEILGVRVPKLRVMARNLENLEFLKADKKGIYELNLLEGIVLSSINLEFDKKLEIYESYLKRADNWALIDAVKFKNPDRIKLFNATKVWLKSRDEFVKRAGYVSLIYHFVDSGNLEYIFSLADTNEFYYDSMAHAWLICECMAKFPNKTLEFLKRQTLKKPTHNRAINKCLESLRVGSEFKEILKDIKKSC